MTDTQGRKKTDFVPCEADVVASVGLDHQNPMRPSTVYLGPFPAAPSLSNLFSEAVWEKGMFTYLSPGYCCYVFRCSLYPDSLIKEGKNLKFITFNPKGEGVIHCPDFLVCVLLYVCCDCVCVAWKECADKRPSGTLEAGAQYKANSI